MKDKLLFGTIGLLVGVVVMQWTMPSGQAGVVGPTVGVVVDQLGERHVLGVDGGIWEFAYSQATPQWVKTLDLPVPVAQVHFIEGYGFVDKNGDLWERGTGQWVNRGQPPVGPVPTSQATFGQVKAQYKSKGDKP
jgi:hypothetical protein